MAKWTVLPVLGTPVEYEAEAVDIAENGDLVIIADTASEKAFAAVWPKQDWAHVRRGTLPFKESDPPGVGNPAL